MPGSVGAVSVGAGRPAGQVRPRAATAAYRYRGLAAQQFQLRRAAGPRCPGPPAAAAWRRCPAQWRRPPGRTARRVVRQLLRRRQGALARPGQPLLVRAERPHDLRGQRARARRPAPPAAPRPRPSGTGPLASTDSSRNRVVPVASTSKLPSARSRIVAASATQPTAWKAFIGSGRTRPRRWERPCGVRQADRSIDGSHCCSRRSDDECGGENPTDDAHDRGLLRGASPIRTLSQSLTTSISTPSRKRERNFSPLGETLKGYG